MKIKVTNADITSLEVDAIVNVANNSLCGGGGVDGAIHKAAGPRLLEYCRNLGGCDTGFAKLTPAFDLPAKYIIHAVGPVWYGGHKGEEQLLSSCYNNSLQLAEDNGLASIAFPAISCGSYRFPKEKAVRIAFETILSFSAINHIKEVIFVCFDKYLFDLYSNHVAGLEL